MSKAEKSTVDSFDLGSFDTKTASEAGQEFEIIHPTHGGTGFFITTLGTHSQRVQTELKRIQNRANAARKGTVRRGEEEEGAQFLADVTTSWRSADRQGKERPVTLNGEVVEFSNANAKRMYLEFPLIAGQVTEHVLDSANFLKG